MAYGIPADLVDDHLSMSESQSIKCVTRFAFGMVRAFGWKYLRAPNAEDTARILEQNAARGFPGMLVCIGGGKTVLRHGMDSFKDTKGFHHHS
jgi:hypothetical protein